MVMPMKMKLLFFFHIAMVTGQTGQTNNTKNGYNNMSQEKSVF
jgi:hypothetical protein